jgi:protein phosphatase 1 regulatory subunit 11
LASTISQMSPPSTRTVAPRSGTQTQTTTQPRTSPRTSTAVGTLVLRPEERSHIRWAEDVIDNEGLGRKSSKVCCIYHKPRAVGESSSEDDSSSSDSDSDSEPDNGTARMAAKKNKHAKQDHKHGHECDGDHGEESSQGDGSKPGKSKEKARRSSPNAYEKMPKARASTTKTQVIK